ncbi:MAG: sugar-binding domain-containing protein [Pseudomonadota bacterium]
MASVIARRAGRPDHGDDIIIEAAWLYYEDGLNQNDIAERLGVSRATVVNYLQEARERAYVRISLSQDAFSGHRLAVALKEALSLTDVIIMPDADEVSATARRVARGAARWLPQLLSPGDRLGVAWGKTIFDVAESIEPSAIADLTVLQLVGSMATPYGFSADVCSSYVARRLSADCVNLHVPAIFSTSELAARVRDEALIANQFDAIGHVNKTLFAVGSVLPDSHVVSSGVAKRDELRWYVDRGAVGVLCGRFINADGGHVDGPLDARMMGVAPDAMRAPEMGMLVSVGPERVAAAIAAVRGGYTTHLVTHQSSAEAMLAHIQRAR